MKEQCVGMERELYLKVILRSSLNYKISPQNSSLNEYGNGFEQGLNC